MKTLDRIIQEGKDRFDEQWETYNLSLSQVDRSELYPFLSSFAREVAEGALEAFQEGNTEGLTVLQSKQYEALLASRAKAFLNE